MHIIIRHDLSTRTDSVLNILYGEDYQYAENWINTYINEEIESLKITPNNIPLLKDNTTTYTIKEDDNQKILVKNYKKLKEGYLYNSNQKYSDKLFSIRLLDFDESNSLFNGQYGKESFLSNI